MSSTRGKNIYEVKFESDINVMAIAEDFIDVFKHYKRLGYPGIVEIHRVTKNVAIEIIPFDEPDKPVTES
jgi:hypothetical protein